MIFSRDSFKTNYKPSVRDGVLLFLIELVAMQLFGGILQMNYGRFGFFLSQIMMVMIVLIYSWYIKIDYMRVFKINKISLKKMIYSILVFFAFMILVWLIGYILVRYSSSASKNAKVIQNFLFGKNFILNTFIAALLPAVCEELVFRGFILSAFSSEKKVLHNSNESNIINKGLLKGLNKLTKDDYKAILLTGILFGIMHIIPSKIITTGILGIAFSLIAKRTNSIFPSMIVHFLNNFIGILVYMISVGTLIR